MVLKLGREISYGKILSSFKINLMNQKGFAPVIILIVILILAVLGSGAYLLGKSATKPQNPVVVQTPKPIITPQASSVSDETAEWKIFTDNERGFLFKYPSNWDDPDYCSADPESSSNELPANCIKTVIFTNDIPDENAELGRDLILISSTQIKIDGYDAKRKIFSVADSIPDTYQVWVYKDNKTIMLWLSYVGSGTSKEEGDNFVHIFDQILSTFKFLP